MTADDKKTLLRLFPDVAVALAAAAVHLERRRDLNRAMDRHLQTGRHLDAYNGSGAREEESARALAEVLRRLDPLPTAEDVLTLYATYAPGHNGRKGAS